MSDLPMDLQEQIARIDDLREEALKFAAEQHKLTEEALKVQRDRWLAPLIVVFSGIAAAGGILSSLHALGVF